MRKEKFISYWEKKRTAGSLKYVLKLGLFISLGSSAILWVVTSVQLADRKEIALLEAFDLALRHFFLSQLIYMTVLAIGLALISWRANERKYKSILRGLKRQHQILTIDDVR